MNRPTLILLKSLVWLACLVPCARLVWGAVTNHLGPDPAAEIAFSTGLATLRLLTITLAITPLRRSGASLVPALAAQFNWLIKFRRLVGLFAFFYATLHVIAWVALYSAFDLHAMLADVARRRFIAAGVAAYLLLLPLALTSTTFAIRKLGGRNWNRLHRLVYIAATCGVIHYWWQVKPGVRTPITITAILALLFLARPITAWLHRRKAHAAA
ncbi:MAG: protein-methionine-sulfoxide reductase heme-binding subunit MsrQ [Terracidiphilus sp.]|jgi:sulfoxide reductase heme-binding subunit YedZ